MSLNNHFQSIYFKPVDFTSKLFSKTFYNKSLEEALQGSSTISKKNNQINYSNQSQSIEKIYFQNECNKNFSEIRMELDKQNDISFIELEVDEDLDNNVKISKKKISKSRIFKFSSFKKNKLIYLNQKNNFHNIKKCFICLERNKKNNKSPICNNCYEPVQNKIDNFNIIIYNEIDKFENLEIKKRIGNKFQANIPELDFSKSDDNTDISFTIKKDLVENKYNFIQLHTYENKLTEFEINSFSDELMKLFDSKRRDMKNNILNQEKILFILNIFQYDWKKCLNYVKSHLKSWELFFRALKM